MKKIVLIILGLLLILTSYAQGAYRVDVSSALNARELPQEHAKVITQLKNGEVVDVIEITDGWAKINYDNRYLYISSKYIKKVESSPVEQDKFSYNGNFLERIKIQIPDTQWMIYPIIFLSVILWLLRIKRDNEYLEDGLYIANLICFFLLCTLEILYVVGVKGDATFFCSPDSVGWIWTFVNFVLFSIFVYNQILVLLDTFCDMRENMYSSIDLRWGIYAWPMLVICIIIGIFFPVMIGIGVGAFLICQLIQVILIFTNIIPNGGWGNSFIFLTIYILGSISTAIVITLFITILIIVLLACLVLKIIGGASTSSSSSSSYEEQARRKEQERFEEEERNSRSGSLSWDNEFIHDGNGRTARITDVDSDGTIRDSDGNRWEDYGWSGLRKK